MTPGQNPTLQRRSACVTAWRRASFDFTIRLACANSFLGRLILRHNQSESVIRFRNILHILVSPLRPVRLLAELCTLNPAVQCRNPLCWWLTFFQAGVTFRAFRFRISAGDLMNSTATNLKDKTHSSRELLAALDMNWQNFLPATTATLFWLPATPSDSARSR